MKEIKVNSEFFDIESTLTCGQVFRFRPFKSGYILFSKDKACYLYKEKDTSVIVCEEDSKDYFYNYFDLETDYSVINNKAKSYGIDALTDAAEFGKGIRILKQDSEETLFSFIISQNNFIPRIKNTIEKLCENYGEEKTFLGEKYFSFPTAEKLSEIKKEEYKNMGFGYRDEYFVSVSDKLSGSDFIEKAKTLSAPELKKSLLSLKGVGNKVCDCVMLFGFNKSSSFPVDTWIYKVYKEDMGGTLTDRKKISEYFVSLFKENAGLYQQYLFYYKRK